MFDRIIRSLATAARRTSAGYVLTLGACIVVACTWAALAGRVQAATKHAPQKAIGESPNAGQLNAPRRAHSCGPVE